MVIFHPTLTAWPPSNRNVIRSARSPEGRTSPPDRPSGLDPVAGRQAKVTERPRAVQRVQFAPHDRPRFGTRRAALVSRPMKTSAVAASANERIVPQCYTINR